MRTRGVGEWMVEKLCMKYINTDSQWGASHITAAIDQRGFARRFPYSNHLFAAGLEELNMSKLYVYEGAAVAAP